MLTFSNVQEITIRDTLVVDGDWCEIDSIRKTHQGEIYVFRATVIDKPNEKRIFSISKNSRMRVLRAR